jgi:hypothetical protein
MTTKLLYGKNVIYNEKIGKIKNISKTSNVLIQLISDNSIIYVEKTKLKIIPHDTNDVIKYKNVYYIIKNYSFNNNILKYELSYINKTENNYNYIFETISKY